MKRGYYRDWIAQSHALRKSFIRETPICLLVAAQTKTIRTDRLNLDRQKQVIST